MGAKGFYFDVFSVDEPTGNRWTTALDLLREGKKVVLQGVALTVRGPELLADLPAWVDVQHMPESVAVRELARAEDLITTLQGDAVFAALATGRRVEIRLVNESYGWLYATRRNGQTIFTDEWMRHHQPDG